MTTTVLQTCMRCGSRMEGEFRGLLANAINLKNTNIIICTNKLCKHTVDMNEFKKRVLCQ